MICIGNIFGLLQVFNRQVVEILQKMHQNQLGSTHSGMAAS